MSTIEQFMIPIFWKTEEITATADQDTFNLTTISIPGSSKERVKIRVNGKKQPDTAYTINSSTQLVTSEPLELNDLLEVEVIERK